MSAFFFPLYICRVTLNFSSTLKTCVLFMTVAMLLLYQSPANYRNSNVKGNFTHKINYRHYGHFLGPEFYIYPEREGSLSSQGRGDG